MNKKIVAKLVIEVVYEDEANMMTPDEMREEAHLLLNRAAHDLDATGIMSGDSQLTIGKIKTEVTTQPLK